MGDLHEAVKSLKKIAKEIEESPPTPEQAQQPQEPVYWPIVQVKENKRIIHKPAGMYTSRKKGPKNNPNPPRDT